MDKKKIISELSGTDGRVFVNRSEFAKAWGCSADYAARLLKSWGVSKVGSKYFIPDIAAAIKIREEVPS